MRKLLCITLVLIGALALAGCSDGGSSSGAGGTTVTTVSDDGKVTVVETTKDTEGANSVTTVGD